MGLLLAWRHGANIQKLIKGTESKIGQKAPAAAAAHHPPDKHGGHHAHRGEQRRHHGAKR